MPPALRSPAYDLDQSLEVARKIVDRGAGATLSQPELAAFLNYKSVNNGAFITRVASARHFGLIDGIKNAYRATPLAEAIIHPDYPETAAQARLEAFRNVPLYSAYLDAFRGRPLPDDVGAVNALVSRFGIPQKDAKSILARLMASAEQAGLFKVAGSERMIEPTVGSAPTAQPPADKLELSGTYVVGEATTRRFPKIIDGALDLMPSGPPWDEAEYQEWLSFFDQACRVYYRVARKPTEVP
ncbi:hypothetical protein BH24CHL5_BH24CHL5_03080 [soil metagenome]